ncbi:MAG TPA: A24 family peptidase [Spirochaetota bacterium]|nr:A24 family peptidase [Spirochaetota bacterium]HPC41867.1 A24 family peptidase [Spirochaetota bacterium]HPL15050.1 A24 family peptidase [Spirochaetota bacterium]HQF09578.1 A24 family peptidase [Spirochaetota bacterium]HQH98352.1 A24 family peptidase [Spirochaetota bacterium]
MALSFFAGTFFGSFFYTLALRFADGRIHENPIQALFSRSRCPSCKNIISPILLAPILGFIIQRGKCHRCGTQISLLYPTMEMCYGLLALLFTWKLGISLLTANFYLLSALALCITIIDIKSLTIPNSLVITFVILSAYPIVMNYNILDNIYGLLALFAFFIVILLIFPGAFGGGDLKLGSAIGLLAGLEMSIVILEVSLVTGAITGVIVALKTGKSLKTKIPFAPFLTLGLIVAILYGRDILLVYYRILY